MTAIITDWTAQKASALGHETLTYAHALHERPMFSDEALAAVLDRYPRESLGVYTMGEDLMDWRSWRRGEADGLSGDKLMEAMTSGRLWLNLRYTNEHLPEYAKLCAEMCGELEQRAPGLRTFRRDLGLLISSPKAQVFYHLDVPLVSLWQIRGAKTIWFYPRQEPYVPDEHIERMVMRETEGQCAFRPEWDGAAEAIELLPGAAVAWPQNVPHRVANADVVNVSLSLEYMTPAALFRANLFYANALLRRRLGVRPRVQSRPVPTALAKLALARAVKLAAKARKSSKTILPATFVVDPARPGGYRSLEA